uniref:Uncharacterized protein n=1 Tax=Micrurus spixii TaxID=129469 RepID=A0A2D4NED2_9SAUR
MQEETLACCCVILLFNNILGPEILCLWSNLSNNYPNYDRTPYIYIYKAYIWKKKGVMAELDPSLFPATCEFRGRFQCITLTYKNQVSSRAPFEALSPLYLHPLQQIKAKKK